MMLIKSIGRLFSKRDRVNDERYWGGAAYSKTSSGVTVTPDEAEKNAAVYRCVRFLSESLAKLPLIVYKRGEGGTRQRDSAHPLYRLLHTRPNRWQTSFEFREMMMGHVLLRGNAYAYKRYDQRKGYVSELVPLNPTKVEPVLKDSGEVIYLFTNKQGQRLELPGSDVFHVKGPSSDGVTGLSCITYARESIGLALVAEEFGARTFANDAQPGGILTHPGKLDEKALANLRESIEKHHASAKNARKWVIVEEGMKWEKIGMTADDTQFIQTREFQIEEICRWFGVPPHKIGYMKHATFSNIEHQALEFVTDSLLPWLCRWEQAIGARLFDDDEQETHYVEFLVDALLRGDTQTRYSAYSIGRQWGWLSADDVRKLENMDPLPDKQGEKYLVPMNMVDASRLDDVIDSKQSAGKVEKDPPQAIGTQSGRNFVGEIEFKPAIRHCLERYIERLHKSNKPKEEHRQTVIEGLKPYISGVFALNLVDEKRESDSLSAELFEELRKVETEEEFGGEIERLESVYVRSVRRVLEKRGVSARVG